MSAAGEREGGAEKKRPDARGDRITQDIQQQARQKESPVISELLLAAKKGHTEQVIKLLQQDPGKAVVTDKVWCEAQCETVPMIMQGFIPFPSTGERAYIWRALVATSQLL